MKTIFIILVVIIFFVFCNSVVFAYRGPQGQSPVDNAITISECGQGRCRNGKAVTTILVREE